MSQCDVQKLQFLTQNVRSRVQCTEAAILSSECRVLQFSAFTNS